MKLLTMSLSGALIICVILLVRLILQNKVHRTVWLLLWAVAVLRLLLPVSVAADTSVFNLLVFRTTEPIAAVQTEAAPSVQTMQPVQAAQTEGPTLNKATAKALSATDILKIVWLAGAAAVFGYFIINHIFARRRYRFAIPADVSDVPQNVCVRELEGLTSPLTYGLFRPVILLPFGMSKDKETCSRIIAHELSHIRHADVAYKGVLLLATAVHWFNPFVWVMLFTASQDMEMRCDADAIRALNGEKNAYAKTLVEAEATKLRSYLQTGFSFSSTAQRLRAIVKAKASKPLSICTGLLLTALLLLVFCTGQTAAKAAPASQKELPAVTTLPPVFEAEATTAPYFEPIPAQEHISPETETAPAPETEAVQETEAPTGTEAPTEAPAELPAVIQTDAPEPTEAPKQTSSGNNSYDKVVTVRPGQMISVYLYSFDWSYPTSSDSGVAQVVAAYGALDSCECVILGGRAGTAVITCTGGTGTYRVLVRVEEPQPPEVDFSTQNEPVQEQPDYAALILGVTEEEP